jgi:site-specific recombinase
MFGLNATKTNTAHNQIDTALQRFTRSEDDPVALLRGLMDAIRPADGRDGEAATKSWRVMNAAVMANDAYRQAVSAKVLELLATRRLLSFLTEEGILPDTGFFSELWRKLAHKLLPELLDERVFKDCLDVILHQRNDHVWFNAIPLEDKLVFWRSLDWDHAPDAAQVNTVYEQLLEALLVVSHRTLALAFHPELRRVCPEVEERPSPFLVLHQELSRWVDHYQARRADPATATEQAPGPLQSLVACRGQLSHAFLGTFTHGVRLRLSYLLTRLDQHLDRLSLLYGMLSPCPPKQGNGQFIDELDNFIQISVVGETQRNNIRKHCSELVRLLAMRITENASRTGEHYITTDWSGLRALWRSAMGAGIIVACMALIKIYASRLGLAPGGFGVACSLNYGLGFVLIALLHFTIATKQPAFTAAKIADVLHTSRGKLRHDAELVGLIVDTLRSQVAAILGNVLLALMTATAIALLFAGAFGRPVVDATEANYLIGQLKPLGGLNLLYAAIAGVWLFFAGLIAGYSDNLETYSRLGERISRVRWLTVLLGGSRAQRVGAFVDQNFGTLMSNFLFGWMLGMTGPIGVMLGLPIDVRHVSFSAANLGLALAALDYQVPAGVVLQAGLGVGLIGCINLTVSFLLALYVALRSRGASFDVVPSVAAHVVQRLLKNPLRLLIPSRASR